MDRFDYMRRDPLHLGLQDLVFHPQFYFENFKIVEGDFCFNNKSIGKIYDFFGHRYRLYTHLYSNPKAEGYDLVVKDLFLAANSHYNFDEKVNNPEEYLKLHNGIIY